MKHLVLVILLFYGEAAWTIYLFWIEQLEIGEREDHLEAFLDCLKLLRHAINERPAEDQLKKAQATRNVTDTCHII